MKGKLTTVAIVLLAIMNVLTFIYATQSKADINDLTIAVESKTNKVVVYEGKDGYTPVKGVDYNDGANGISSMSYTITTTTLKEVPLIGEKGETGSNGKDGTNGLDAPTQEIRINSETGDLQSKLSNERFWSILIPCSQLQVGCP